MFLRKPVYPFGLLQYMAADYHFDGFGLVYGV
jgi:hypothetical protein